MKISVILTSYNYEQYIEEAINSVINQTYDNWELIIVDDASSDNSIEIIKSFCKKDERIKLFCHDTNKGLAKSIQTALENSTGNWIAFLESDDAFAPDNLEKKIKIANEAKLIFNKVKFVNENTCAKRKRFEKVQNKLSQTNFPKNMFYDFGVENPILTFSCVMVEKSTLIKADFNCPFDEALDRHLWIQIAQNSQFYYVDEELTNWRLHDKSYMKKNKKPLLYFPQIYTYFKIFKKDKNPLLLIFILYSFILSCFSKIKD